MPLFPRLRDSHTAPAGGLIRFRHGRAGDTVTRTACIRRIFAPARAQRRAKVYKSDDDASEIMSADLPSGIFLLDVREDDEWAAGHAPDAVHLRLSELTDRSREIPRDRDVYVICRSGARSAYAAHALAGAGWTAVNVADGMTGWAVAGRPMISETGAEPYVA